MWKQLILGIIAIGCLAALSATPLGTQGAAQPHLFVTWNASAYAPADFRGKILPTSNSLITVSFMLVDQGGAADLSRQMIYWYVNDGLIENRVGVQRIAFRAPAIVGGTVAVRVELPNYRGGAILKTIEIPVVQPEAVIEAPFPGGVFVNSPIRVIGRPYFFNAENLSALSFSWKVNGRSPEGSEDPAVLDIALDPGVPSNTVVTVNLSVQNPADIFEGAAKTVRLVFVK